MIDFSFVRRALVLAALACACTAQAQGFPGKTLTLVVPYPAGGPADATARWLEPGLRKSLGQVIVVDNVGGAGGALGIQKVLGAPADGHQFLMGTPSDVILTPLALTAVKHRPEQLRLVGLATRAPLVLVGNMQLSARSVQELLSGAQRPGARELSYGSLGAGSLYHLLAEDLSARQKIRMTHVPYKGVAPLLQDLMGGQIDLAFLPAAGNLGDLIQHGKLRAFAVTDGQRLARMPEVPTMNEALVTQDFVYEIWAGLFVPRAVPADAAQRLNTAVNDALQDPDYRRQVEATGANVGARLGLAEADSYLADQTARYRRIAQAVKLEPQ
ncbi:tripartite tricarboxylate transporter substrate binding protein [Ramlibacter sp. WS9]|uniref:tripartite tricarboxylate transporter substrate binding protein n=1 Tax=Ramlibacter sp. WS9 TaxID=1882741 RepID=UPI00114152FE|nr:tripartite tricarboxylate transporter substrate binding protein [Ramlibacter sp. WS9]ROZ71280.1 tripartite tricarboxylate transporter substrate binding protein [Ramlibacter sp. WS9]